MGKKQFREQGAKGLFLEGARSCIVSCSYIYLVQCAIFCSECMMSMQPFVTLPLQSCPDSYTRVREIHLNLQSFAGHLEFSPDISFQNVWRISNFSLDILSGEIKLLRRTFSKFAVHVRRVRRISRTLLHKEHTASSSLTSA